MDTLSGGERQRVAIAAALALRPRVLVLDEPTSQLDPKSAEDVLNALVRLNSDLGLTVIIAEHRLERVLPFADSVLYLGQEEGETLLGDPRVVLSQIELGPPLVRLGKALAWEPLPLTVKEGLRFSRQWRQEHATVTGVAATLTNGDLRLPSSSTKEPFLSVRHVGASYDARTVLHDIDLDVNSGEIVVLMGRNGAGKTTLLKALVGLVRPKRGKITVNGQDTAQMDIADICRRVGYLPQDPNSLLFADTVLEELWITLRNHELTPEHGVVDLPIEPQELLTRLGLADSAGAYPCDLSTGQRQRVALAAITVTRPGALLLDEPTRGLDYLAKARLTALLKEWRQAGMAIVVVTHDVELAATIADRVVLMSQGEVLASGAPASVLGASPLFAPQVARLFPNTGWLTVEDALEAEQAADAMR